MRKRKNSKLKNARYDNTLAPFVNAPRSAPFEILALFARRREIGYVLMKNSAIYDFGIKSIRGKRAHPAFVKQVAKSIFPLFDKLGSQGVVVIERREDGRRKSAQLAFALQRVMTRFVFGVYPVMKISLAEAKGCLCGEKTVTHQTLIKRIVRMYPTWWTKVFDATDERAMYWKKLLLAIALALAAKEQLERGEVTLARMVDEQLKE